MKQYVQSPWVGKEHIGEHKTKHTNQKVEGGGIEEVSRGWNFLVV